MKTIAECERNILQIISEINTEFPELTKYIDEMSLKYLDNSEVINSRGLEEYYNSLVDVLKEYKKTHSILKENKNLGMITRLDIAKYPLIKNLYKNQDHEGKLTKNYTYKNKITNNKTTKNKTKLNYDYNFENKEYVTAINQQESEDDENNYYYLGADNRLAKNSRNEKVENNITIITSGEGNIGHITAKLFLDEGSNVLLVDLSKELLSKAILNYKLLKLEYILVCLNK